MLIIIAERDCDDPFKADGAIVFEQKTNISDEDVRAHAKTLATSGKYGKIWVCGVDRGDSELIDPELPTEEVEQEEYFDLVDKLSSVMGVDKEVAERCLSRGKLPVRISLLVPF